METRGFPREASFASLFKKELFFVYEVVNFPSLERYKLTVNQVEVQVPVAKNKITTERTVKE